MFSCWVIQCAAAGGTHASPSQSCHQPSQGQSLNQEGPPLLACLVSFMGTPEGGFFAHLAIIPEKGLFSEFSVFAGAPADFAVNLLSIPVAASPRVP